MKYLVAGTIGLFAFATIGGANAKDQSPAPTASPAYDWTGWYAGANIGYGVGSDHSSETLKFPAGAQFSDETFTLGPAGVVGGGQFGGNLQTGNWVLGIEGDWQWTSQKDSVCIQTCSVNTGPVNTALTVTQEIAWLSTLRGRVGYADGAFLWYVTGGGALGRVSSNDVAAAAPPITAGFDHTLAGWTLGGGVETALAGNWTAKLEYLYVDLGNTTDRFVAPFGNIETIHANVHDNIMRLGVDYHFGGASASVSTTYAAAAPYHNWTGFYVGANAGYGFGHNTGNEILPVPPAFPAFTGQSFTHAPTGWPVGAQVGYNWQAGNWVTGLEGDWQWTNQNDSISISLGTPSANINHDGLTLDETLRWLTTLRGRIGYDRDNWLWYLTGGGAFGSVKENDTLTLGGATTAASFNHTQGGWTLGAGVEKIIAGNWTAKLEYLYVDLGSITDSFVPAPGATEIIHQNVTDHIARLGLNYRY